MKFCTTCGQPLTQKADNLFVCKNGHDNWLNAVAGPTLCVLKDAKLLFGLRAHNPYKGKLDLPGGFLDLNETLEEAAIREGKEEIGADIEIIDYLGSYPGLYFGNSKPVINVTYIVRVKGDGELQAGDDLAGGELVWRSLDDLPTEAELAWSWPLTMFPDLKRWYANHRDSVEYH